MGIDRIADAALAQRPRGVDDDPAQLHCHPHPRLRRKRTVAGSERQIPAKRCGADDGNAATTELHAGIVIAVLAAIGAWFLLFRTTEGLRLRASGFNRSAAKWAGINVDAQLVRAMAISGAMAGLAGGIELLGVTHRLFERFAAGYGYAGIAVALLAQLHPLGAIASAFFFGALTTGAGELQRTAGISSTVATFGQAVVILMMIVLTRRKET